MLLNEFELTIKKSKFIGLLYKIDNEKDIKKILNDVKSMHPKANEINKFKLNHTDPSLNHRGEYRIVYPYGLKTGPVDNTHIPNDGRSEDPEVESNLEDEDIQKRLEAKFDELFGSLSS